MPTKSYKRFQKNIETVNRLKDSYHQIREARGSRGRAAFDHITRSAIIFLASSFEVYIEDVIKESCTQHISFSGDASGLPNSVKKTINEFVKVDSNGTPPIELYDEGWRQVYRKIVENRADKLNTPKKVQITHLFIDLVGIAKSNIDQINNIDNLDAVIAFRGEIAHRVHADKYVKIEQVIEKQNIISEVAEGIDRMILQYFRDTYPGNRLQWNDAY